MPQAQTQTQAPAQTQPVPNYMTLELLLLLLAINNVDAHLVPQYKYLKVIPHTGLNEADAQLFTQILAPDAQDKPVPAGTTNADMVRLCEITLRVESWRDAISDASQEEEVLHLALNDASEADTDRFINAFKDGDEECKAQGLAMVYDYITTAGNKGFIDSGVIAGDGSLVVDNASK